MSGDVTGWLSQCVSNPPPFSLLDFFLSGQLVGSLPQVVVADDFWPVDSQDLSQTAVDERLDFSGGCLRCSPGFCPI